MGGIPDDIEAFPLAEEDPVTVPGLIRDAFGLSGSEARRLLTQGAVKVDGEILEAQEAPRVDLVGRVLQVGKRRFVRLVG
jgi:tyrosyl-tRNA synthetase